MTSDLPLVAWWEACARTEAFEAWESITAKSRAGSGAARLTVYVKDQGDFLLLRFRGRQLTYVNVDCVGGSPV